MTTPRSSTSGRSAGKRRATVPPRPQAHAQEGADLTTAATTVTAAATALTVVLVAVALAVALWPHHQHAGTPGRAPASTAYTVLAPADGDLSVGTLTVHQLAGNCATKDACSFRADQDPPLVKIPATVSSVPVTAGTSTTFTVSAYDRGGTTTNIRLAISRGRLLMDGLRLGTYRVAVTGDRGGVWQFDLKRTKSRH